MLSRRLSAWWPVAAAAGTGILSAILAVVLLLGIQRRNAEADRRAQAELAAVQQRQRDALCAVVIVFDDNYRAAPPVTEAGRRNAAGLARLRADLGCPERKDS